MAECGILHLARAIMILGHPPENPVIRHFPLQFFIAKTTFFVHSVVDSHAVKSCVLFLTCIVPGTFPNSTHTAVY